METYRELAIDLPNGCSSIRSEVHQFAAEVIRPAAGPLDRASDPKFLVEAESPLWPVLKGAYGLGYHRALLPKQFGGMGLPPVAVHVLLEELGWGSAGIALSLVAAAIPAMAVLADGRKELIDQFVKPFVQNRDASWIGCWALSEPAHGSDNFDVGSEEFRHPTSFPQLAARSDGVDYILDGRKASWITNGGIATHALCSVAIEPSRATRRFVLVPLNLQGITRGDAALKLGQREMNQAAIFFDQVRVPRTLMLKGEGYEREVAKLLALAHSAMAAVLTGTARAAYETALEHVKRRRQGGKAIADHQLVQRSLFGMFTAVEACRALSRTVLVHNLGAAVPSLESAIAAKEFCSRMACEVADQAMQLHGAEGLCAGNTIEKLFRDARVCRIEQGTNEVLALTAIRQVLR